MYLFTVRPLLIDKSVKCTHIPASITIQYVASQLTSRVVLAFSLVNDMIAGGDCGGRTRSQMKIR